jgi:hypothetical protein
MSPYYPSNPESRCQDPRHGLASAHHGPHRDGGSRSQRDPSGGRYGESQYDGYGGMYDDGRGSRAQANHPQRRGAVIFGLWEYHASHLTSTDLHHDPHAFLDTSGRWEDRHGGSHHPGQDHRRSHRHGSRHNPVDPGFSEFLDGGLFAEYPEDTYGSPFDAFTQQGTGHRGTRRHGGSRYGMEDAHGYPGAHHGMEFPGMGLGYDGMDVPFDYYPGERDCRRRREMVYGMEDYYPGERDSRRRREMVYGMEDYYPGGRGSRRRHEMGSGMDDRRSSRHHGTDRHANTGQRTERGQEGSRRNRRPSILDRIEEIE